MSTVFVRIWALLILVLPLGASDTITGKQADQILSELRQIRKLLESGGSNRTKDPQPTRITVDPKGAPFLGSQDADVSIVEFMDYQCPYCRQFHSQTFQNLKKIYIDTGKARFYVMDFPLDIHPQALLAAEGARCAAEQGKFWPMHDRLESANETLSSDKIIELADRSGLEVARFRSCLDSSKYRQEIRQEVTEATSRGIHATQTFVVGRNTQNGVDGEVVLGAVPLGVIQQKIEAVSK